MNIIRIPAGSMSSMILIRMHTLLPRAPTNPLSAFQDSYILAYLRVQNTSICSIMPQETDREKFIRLATARVTRLFTPFSLLGTFQTGLIISTAIPMWRRSSERSRRSCVHAANVSNLRAEESRVGFRLE